MESDCSVPEKLVEVVAQLINLNAYGLCSCSCLSVEPLSASSSAASHQNFLTPTFLVSVALSCRK